MAPDLVTGNDSQKYFLKKGEKEIFGDFLFSQPVG